MSDGSLCAYAYRGTFISLFFNKVNLKYIITYCLLILTTFVVGQEVATLRVVDDEEQPIPNAHVLIKETNQLVLSNSNGELTIDFKEHSPLTLEISFIGFTQKNVVVTPNQKLKVQLKSTVVSLNSFVVTGQYSENSPEKAVQKITIIPKEKIEKMAAVNLSDVLQNETNIRLTKDGVLGTSMSVQGMSGENVKILIDGVAVIGRLGGDIDLSQINLNDVERIEIIEGPMSVNYGTNALAGVVNIITKQPVKNRLTTQLNSYYENIGNYNFDGTISSSIGKHSYTISGGRNYFDGWIEGDPLFGENQPIADSSRYKTWKPKEQFFGRLKYQYQQKKKKITYSLSAFDEKITNRGLPRLQYFETAFDDYYNTLRLDNSIQLQTPIKENQQFQLLLAYNYYKRIKNTFFKDLTNLNETLTTNASDQDTSVFDLITLRSTYANTNSEKSINYELGVDLNRESTQGARIEGKTKQIGDYAGFMSLEYRPFKKTTIRPGLRYAYNTDYASPITPSLNIKQDFKKWKLRASYARGFRAPSLKELYFDFVDINHNIFGNTDLKAETSDNFNGSISYTKLIKSYLLKIEATSFYNKIENLITLAQGEGTSFSYVNIGQRTTYGAQLNSNISYNHFKMGLGLSLIARENELAQTVDIDAYNYSPEVRLNANYDIKKWKSFIAFFYKYNGRLSSFRLDVDDQIVETYLASYQIADVSIGKKMLDNRVAISIGSKNLLDVKNVNAVETGGAHSDSSGSNLVATGRTYFAKISIQLTYDKSKK